MHLEPLLGSVTGYTLGTRVLVRREANSVFIGGGTRGVMKSLNSLVILA